ncbi:MAG: pentapeptide repeat-containing protein [Xenococcus sp. (in: cyanobacteria)]
MQTCFPDQQDQQLSNNNLPNPQLKKPLGAILLEAGLVSNSQIEISLAEQKQNNQKIGKILAYHGWINQKTADFFVEKWSIFLRKTQRRPLAFYLFAAGLLDHEQLSFLKHQQKKINSEARLHTLAVEHGYITQVTVNFFLKYLYNLDQLQNISVTDLYEVIKNYINGEIDFQRLELCQASLNGVKLDKILLDNSILIQASLNNSNLSCSSLIGVNLTLADLELANLSYVNFKQAYLIEANLRRSNLEQAYFQGANLQEADLRGANLLNASFAGADLRGAKFSPAYSYNVYYDKQTVFDANFNPIKAGWKLKNG